MNAVEQGRRHDAVEQQPVMAGEQWMLLKATLDELQHATLICRSSANVVVGNDAAYDILRHEDGICVRTGRLSVRDDLTHQKLRSAMSERAAQCDDRERVALLVPRPSGAPSYQLIARRLPVAATGDLRLELWAVTISDPGAAGAPCLWAAARLYNFTPAETRLAERLAAGYELQEIAQQLGVKITTIRSQLASLFAKTGTDRQAQLVRLLTAHALR